MITRVISFEHLVLCILRLARTEASCCSIPFTGWAVVSLERLHLLAWMLLVDLAVWEPCACVSPIAHEMLDWSAWASELYDTTFMMVCWTPVKFIWPTGSLFPIQHDIFDQSCSVATSCSQPLGMLLLLVTVSWCVEGFLCWLCSHGWPQWQQW